MPCTLRPQGKEIVRTWLYFTLLKAWLLDKKQAFENCWIHMHVVDEKGEKMSKSVGNVVDPQEILKKYGADAFRIWTCLEGEISKGDIRCSFERIEGTSKFLTKFWNISRFISAFPQPEKRSIILEPADRWILAELAQLVGTVKEKYENYEFHAAATAIRDFTWNVLAAHYIELVKPRAYDAKGKRKDAPRPTKAAWYTLHQCLRTIMLLVAPVVPFMTDHIWLQMYAKSKRDSIHIEAFPKTAKPDKAAKKMLKLGTALTEFNSLVWNTKKEQGLSLRDPIGIKMPKTLKPFEKDLKLMHNLMKPQSESKPEKEEVPKAKQKPKKAKKKTVKKAAKKPAKKKPRKKKA
jgi:valyl-tRNA synthetase